MTDLRTATERELLGAYTDSDSQDVRNAAWDELQRRRFEAREHRGATSAPVSWTRRAWARDGRAAAAGRD